MKHILLLSFILFISCKKDNTVQFDEYVDTSSKEIKKQEKKTYFIDIKNIYASNNFDGARLNGFKLLNDTTALVIVNPENEPINNSPYYAFKTWADSAQVFYYKFKYPEGYKHRYIPKLKINEYWSVIDSTDIFKTDSIVTIKLNLTKTPQIVAAQELQTSSDVENWYSQLIKRNSDIVNFENYGTTRLGRDLPVLSLSIGDTKGKDVVLLLTRQHPPEVTGFYAFQYFLETILNGSELSTEFLKKYQVLAFPILNPDGVDLGHWRHNSNGIDLNRDWSKYNQLEIKQTVNFISKMLKENDADLVLGLDFHSTRYDIFYTNKERKSTAFPNFIQGWFEGLEANIPDYEVNESSSNSNKPVSKGWMLYGHNAVGITYEIGDSTSKEKIEMISKISAEEMMKLLNKY